MSIIDLLKRKDYLNSSNKSEYDRIASIFGVRPLRVYRLAHGLKPRRSTDVEILGILLDEGIVGKRKSASAR